MIRTCQITSSPHIFLELNQGHPVIQEITLSQLEQNNSKGKK